MTLEQKCHTMDYWLSKVGIYRCIIKTLGLCHISHTNLRYICELCTLVFPVVGWLYQLHELRRDNSRTFLIISSSYLGLKIVSARSMRFRWVTWYEAPVLGLSMSPKSIDRTGLGESHTGTRRAQLHIWQSSSKLFSTAMSKFIYLFLFIYLFVCLYFYGWCDNLTVFTDLIHVNVNCTV